MKFTIEVHRKIKPVSYPYTLSTHVVDVLQCKQTVEAPELCLSYSREANESTFRVEPHLFFLVKDESGLPVCYGSPARNGLKWTETAWIE